MLTYSKVLLTSNAAKLTENQKLVRLRKTPARVYISSRLIIQIPILGTFQAITQKSRKTRGGVFS